MDKSARSALIRALHRAKVGGFAYRHSGKPLRPNTDPIEGPGFGVWGKGGLCFVPYVPPAVPAPKKDLVLRVKRGAKKHALTKIAELYPKRLPRRA
jgi:hypothetical protein